MIWRKKQRSRYEWRRRYAWFPRRIGAKRIWLEWYAVRAIPRDENAPDKWHNRLGCYYECRDEYALQDGYMIERVTKVFWEAEHAASEWARDKPKAAA